MFEKRLFTRNVNGAYTLTRWRSCQWLFCFVLYGKFTRIFVCVLGEWPYMGFLVLIELIGSQKYIFFQLISSKYLDGKIYRTYISNWYSHIKKLPMLSSTIKNALTRFFHHYFNMNSIFINYNWLVKYLWTQKTETFVIRQPIFYNLILYLY